MISSLRRRFSCRCSHPVSELGVEDRSFGLKDMSFADGGPRLVSRLPLSRW